ncbi:MAG: 4,5-DOPA dioxygenase extradiol [Actinobacteria bacterium]|nr:4,5-DOPA dioxygenase extradiol [Actinomycetota bacterium]
MTTPNPVAPAVFFGHGSPMNAIELNRYSKAWREYGASVDKPKAILAISAHWFTRGTSVTAMPKPRTIHDFGGFPDELYRAKYPAPGDPALAKRVASTLSDLPVSLDTHWGLDHGTWSVLVHVFPEADVPVVQLSIDGTKPASWHWALAERLAELRRDNVMILGSGNVTHNFSEIEWGATHEAKWAVGFDRRIWEAVKAGDKAPLIDYLETPDGRRAAPTADHYLPVIYAAAARLDGDVVSEITSGIDLGSFSMRSFELAGA